MKPPSKPERLSSLLGGASFIFLCRVGGAALTFGTQVLLARWMGASELGVYVVAFSWCLLLTTIGGAGLPFAAIRFVGDGLARADTAHVRRFFTAGAYAVVSISATIAALGALILYFGPAIATRYFSLALVFALAVLPFYALLRFVTGCANAMSLFPLSFIPNNLVRPASFLLAVAALWFFGGLLNANTAMFWHALVIAVTAIATAFLLWRIIRALDRDKDHTAAQPEHPEQMRFWLRISVPLLLLDLFGSYFPELTVVFLSAYLTSPDIAIYNAAFRTAMLIMFGLNAVDAFVAPEIARAYAAGDRSALTLAVNRATQLRFWGSVAGAAVLLLFGNHILGIFGPEFVAGQSALGVLTLALVVSGAVGPVMRILSVTGHQDRCVFVFILTALVAVGLIAVLVPRFGVTGAAWAASAAMIIGSLAMRALVVKFLDLRPRFIMGGK